MNYKDLASDERNQILDALEKGLVPERGVELYFSDRRDETVLLDSNLSNVVQGHSHVQLLAGPNGTGKTTLAQKISTHARVNRNMVTMRSKLTLSQRLYGTDGQALALYQQLVRSASTREHSASGLRGILDDFSTSAAGSSGDVVARSLTMLESEATGPDVAAAISAYSEAHAANDDRSKSQLIRYLSGDFRTKADVRSFLRVASIPNDANCWSFVRSLCSFFRVAGYAGLFVQLDEFSNVGLLPNKSVITKNLERLHTMLDDSQDRPQPGLAVLFIGTTDFVMDDKRGVMAHPALKSRLSSRVSAATESSAILMLKPLPKEELLLACQKIRNVAFDTETDREKFPDTLVRRFLEIRYAAVGAAMFTQARDVLKDFASILRTCKNNPTVSWDALATAAAGGSR